MAYKINKQSWIQLKANKEDNYNLAGLGNQQQSSQLGKSEIAH